MNRQHHFEAGGEARKYQELTFGFPCIEQPSARIHTRQKPLRRKKKSEKDLALVALALLMYAFVGLETMVPLTRLVGKNDRNRYQLYYDLL